MKRIIGSMTVLSLAFVSMTNAQTFDSAQGLMYVEFIIGRQVAYLLPGML